MSRFTDALVVSPLADGKTWVLVRSFGYEVGALGSGDVVECRIGFMTDFASIPRPFWTILPKWGKYGNAAVIHDWLYWSQDRSRHEADRIIFEAMGVLNVSDWQRYAIYWAVWLFGGMAWARNRWDREAGFDRVIPVDKIKALQLPGRPGVFRRIIKHYAGRK
jgi:hypothetical protein